MSKVIHLDVPDDIDARLTTTRIWFHFPLESRRGVLSDVSIATAVEIGWLIIEPFNPENLQGASYDLTLADDILLMPRGQQGDTALAETVEKLYLPPEIVGELSGRSSIARHFVMPHCQGGYVDPGFSVPPATLTLEFVNHSHEIRSYKRGDRVVQIHFKWMDRAVSQPYNGRYKGQTGPTPSRFGHGQS
jgi:dCTP deaminase